MHRPFLRPMFSIEGNLRTTGGALTLTKGEMAFVDSRTAGPQGAKVLNGFVGFPKREKVLELRMGVSDSRTVTRSRTNKAGSSMPFAIEDVVELRASAPQITEQEFDEVVIGWDGITPGSELQFRNGDAYLSLALEVSGEPVSFLGGGVDAEVVVVRTDLPSCDPLETCEDCDECAAVDCKAVVKDLVDKLRRKQLAGGTKLEELIDIIPVFDCSVPLDYDALTDYTFWTLSLCDTGTEGALALVQSQYPTYKVVRTGRSGSTSTYQVLIPAADPDPADYSYTARSIIKDCDDCPVGYTEVPGGYLYAFSTEADGSTVVTSITNLPGYIGGSVTIQGTYFGVTNYTALFTAKLTDTDIATFVANAPGAGTGTVNYVGIVSSVCDGAATTYEWVEGNSCQVATADYEIILADTKCGDTRLVELQTNYPNLTITLADSDQGSRVLTLSGTSGTANINIDGTDYLATFATNLTTTAANFVTAHGATILTAHGITVTSDPAAGKMTFEGPVDLLDITITNATTNLAGTFAPITVFPVREACSTKYATTVVTNMVCDECDDIFKDYFTSTAPTGFDHAEWVYVNGSTPEASGTCKCGIRFKAKPFIISPEEALRCNINFMETSARIKVSADYPEEIREGIGRIPEGIKVGRYLSTRRDRTHLGGNLRKLEAEGMAYFHDMAGNREYITRILNGETSSIEDDFTQYIHYSLVINHKKVGTMASGINDLIEYAIYVPVGTQANIEAMLNKLAASAGKEGVIALP